MHQLQLGIVIPVFNAATELEPCLGAVFAAAAPATDTPVIDALVVDGGSTDASAARAHALGARVIHAPTGRGTQLRAGAAAAVGDWLLFLHADTVLAANWRARVLAFAANPANAMRAGYGRLRFDDPALAARLVERGAAWRCRRFGLPYGDQGLLLSRRLYEASGGYPDWPLMEDVELARRIGRARLAPLGLTVTTSAARYRRDGWLRRPLRNLFCLALFQAGVSPARIRRVYAR